MAHSVELTYFNWYSPITKLYQASTWACHTITNRWQEAIMIAGVACSVAGAVVSFFQSMPLIACSFLFFGVINVTGLFYMHQINTIRELEREILGSMREENDKLKTTNLCLEKTKSDLEAAVVSLHLEMTIQNKEFEKNNANLVAQIEELTAVVAALKSFSELIVEEISHFKENNQVSRSILSKIEPHVEKADFVLEKIAKQFQSQDQNFSQRIEELTAFFSNAKVQEYIQTLKETSKELKEEMSKMISTQKEYITLQREFATERLLLEQVRKEQEHLHQLLQKDENALSGAVKEFMTQNQELRSGLEALRRILHVLAQSATANPPIY